MQKSYFDGSVLHHVGLTLLSAVISVVTFGIGFPFGYYMLLVWETQHTVINGYRLRYTGTVWDLFFQWLKWWLLTLVTLGIYGFWLPVRVKQFCVKNTVMEGSHQPDACDRPAAATGERSATAGAVYSSTPQTSPHSASWDPTIPDSKQLGLSLGTFAGLMALGIILAAAGILVMLKVSWWGIVLVAAGIGILMVTESKA